MGFHFEGQFSCRWNCFSPGPMAFSAVHGQKLPCPVSRDHWTVLAAELYELVSLPRALQSAPTEVGQIIGSGSRTMSPLK